ncbi:hypothetical protein DPMN_051852 [Dreissena polymorpha]|uniref:Uncharacterized protein n=1 Tax=Dreissena polymorpha TaxID=45954 RepID=A0A9D4HMI1_DREPO|nr:hypothetical protein DPMN_051852 [Dreissena polymorpha]
MDPSNNIYVLYAGPPTLTSGINTSASAASEPYRYITAFSRQPNTPYMFNQRAGEYEQGYHRIRTVLTIT